MVNWDSGDLRAAFESASLSVPRVRVEQRATELRITSALLERWFAVTGDGQPSYASRLLIHLSPEEEKQVQALLERKLRGQIVTWKSTVAYLLAQRSKS